jgi:hypothetical protein
MHIWAAGSDNHAIKFMFFDILSDHFLAGIGAHVFIAFGKNNVWQTGCESDNCFNIDYFCYIGSAPADINSYSW